MDTGPGKLVTVLKGGGEYAPKHVRWLARQVPPHIKVYCLTDNPHFDEPNIERIDLKHGWPGWWSKMEMFRPDLDLGDFIYCDLDTVILDLRPEFLQVGEPVVLADVHGAAVANSGLMFLPASCRAEIWEEWIKSPVSHMRSLHGDQEFIDRFLHDAARWQTLFPKQIVSFKGQISQGYQHPAFYKTKIDEAKIIFFHGKPRPWEVQEPWIPAL